MKYLIISCLLCLGLTSFSQSSLEETLIQYRTTFLPEKIYVHTDKNIYAAGETIWMALYLLDGQTHRPGTWSVVARVELRDSQQKPISELKLFALPGFASGSIELPKDLPPGNYTLVAYTHYQRNSGDETLFYKTLRIVQGMDSPDNPKPQVTLPVFEESIPNSSDIRLRFFPEGGDCITGLPCQIAITAQNSYGAPVSGTGTIKYEGSDIFFSTNKQGLGQFSYKPKLGKSAVASFEVAGNSHSFELPPSLSSGYTLNVRRTASSIQLLLRTNMPQGLKGARAVVHHRGLLFFDNPLEVEKDAAVLNIPLTDLTPGVHVVTLFDPSNQAVAERLFFISPEPEHTQLTFNIDQEGIGIREEVGFLVKMPPSQRIPDSLAGAYISLSVIPEVAGSGMEAADIRSWILLNSDLDVPIPDAPELLFAKSTAERNYLINLYLLTRGWRRFRWEAITDLDAFTPEYSLERGIYIKGQMVKQEAEKQARPGRVFLNDFSSNLAEDTLTDQQGNFELGPYWLFGEKKLILQGRYQSKRKQRANKEITLDDQPFCSFQIESRGSKPESP